MKKNRLCHWIYIWRWEKMFLMMNYFILFMFILTLGVSGNTMAQHEKVKLNMKEVSVQTLFNEIKNQTNLNFLFNREQVDKMGKISINANERTVDEVLSMVFNNTNFTYFFDGNIIIVRPKPETVEQARIPQENSVTLKGKVTDIKGFTLPGVAVFIKGTTIGVATDQNGLFQIQVPFKDSLELMFSFMGMETQEIKVTKLEAGETRSGLDIVLKEDLKTLEDVVVTGYGNVRKSSFTGSSTRVTREELLKVSPGNIIGALQVFDPSLRVTRNIQMGSDPNTLPEFYLRGRSGLNSTKQLDEMSSENLSKFSLTTNPNLPVFIMDGFEVSVDKIYDFDPNRISTITILKDAAATALYGSRASNGVIVIETIAPLPGQLRTSYYGTLTVTAPDLSDYNLANAKQKLEAEVFAGLLDAENPYTNQSAYSGRLADYRRKMNNILKGVDTYWLSKPLQTQTNHKHSLFIEGGVETVRFGLGFRYENENGIMKKSFRDRLAADFKIDYRSKGLQVNNQVSLSTMKSKDSPYGSYTYYALQHPYHMADDPETGRPVKLLTGSGERMNSYYEAKSTKNFIKSDYKEFEDNLLVNLYFNSNLHFKGQFAVAYKKQDAKKFYDPASLRYENSELGLNQLGELYDEDLESFKWNTNLLLIYNNIINNHNINSTLGFNANEDHSESYFYHYRGFPNGELSDPAYAYEMVGTPTRDDSRNRLIGLLFSTNYTYKDIYLADVSFRIDGSSKFGSKSRTAGFWATGLGLNIHNYEWMKKYPLIKQFRILGNYGQTGKVDFPSYAAKHTYQIMDDAWHLTGIGAQLVYMGNEKLKWERLNQLNLSLEINLGGWINLELSWYNKLSKDLNNQVSLPLSSGFASYKENMGEMRNRGYEIGLNLNLLKDADWDVNAFFNAAHNKNKILKISESMREYNDRVNEYYDTYEPLWNQSRPYRNTHYGKTLLKYEEGGSEYSIFGMKSLGISPANGKELYMYRDGNVSYEWRSDQQVIIGHQEPKLDGSFGFNIRWKNISLYTSFLFEFGGDIYNQTLQDKIENADVWTRNVDLRVLTQRWKEPGDLAPYKSIKDNHNVTRSTSRFVQRNNQMIFKSLSLEYSFPQKILNFLHVNTLKLQFNMEDLAFFSTVRQERGLDYPFARSFNFSLSTNF